MRPTRTVSRKGIWLLVGLGAHLALSRAYVAMGYQTSDIGEAFDTQGVLNTALNTGIPVGDRFDVAAFVSVEVGV